jgi:hypothetical protein
VARVCIHFRLCFHFSMRNLFSMRVRSVVVVTCLIVRVDHMLGFLAAASTSGHDDKSDDSDDG